MNTSGSLTEYRLNPQIVKFLGRNLPNKFVWPIQKLYKFIRNPQQFFIRKEAARVLLETPPPIRISDDAGFATFSSDLHPDIPKIVNQCKEILLQKQASGELTQLSQKNSKGEFLIDLFQIDGVNDYPEILKFAVSDNMLRIAADYLGTLPRLRYVALWYSPRNDSTISSQLFHTDREDIKSLKAYLNISPVTTENGPFSLFSAAETDRIADKLGPKSRHPMVGLLGRLDDDRVYSVADPSNLIELKGEPGDGAFVDTCRCLHFGSRARKAGRLILVFMYNSFYNVVDTPMGNIDPKPFANDQFRKLVLGVKT